MGQASYPLNQAFHIFAQLGAGITHSHYLVGGTVDETLVKEGQSYTKLTWAGGLGVGYRLSDLLSLNIHGITFLKNKTNPGRYAYLLDVNYQLQ